MLGIASAALAVASAQRPCLRFTPRQRDLYTPQAAAGAVAQLPWSAEAAWQLCDPTCQQTRVSSCHKMAWQDLITLRC